MTGPRWVVFDYGEVISRRTAALPAMAEMFGVPAEEFEPAYFAERESYDWGRPERDHWRAVGSRLGVEVDAQLARELTRIDNEGWLDTDPESLRLLDELDSRSVPLALLSNAPAAFGRAAEAAAVGPALPRAGVLRGRRDRQTRAGDLLPPAERDRSTGGRLPVLRRPAIERGRREGVRDARRMLARGRNRPRSPARRRPPAGMTATEPTA